MRVLITAIFLSATFIANSQSPGVVSTYSDHQTYYSPAALNWNSELSISMLSRKQWVGIANSPFTTFLSVGKYMQKLQSSAGIIASFHSTGYYRESKMELQFAKRMKLEKVKMQVGLSGSFINMELHSPQWSTVDPISQDPAIPTGSTSDIGISLSGGLGIWNKKFFFFAGTQHINEPRLPEVAFTYRRNYSLSTGLLIPFTSSSLFIPSIFMHSDEMTFNVQGDIKLQYKSFITGVGYRLNDAMVLHAGYQAKKIRIGYAFDVTTSELRNYSSGSHELFFTWLIPSEDNSWSCGCNDSGKSYARKNKF